MPGPYDADLDILIAMEQGIDTPTEVRSQEPALIESRHDQEVNKEYNERLVERRINTSRALSSFEENHRWDSGDERDPRESLPDNSSEVRIGTRPVCARCSHAVCQCEELRQNTKAPRHLKQLRLGVVGSRTYADTQAVTRFVRNLPNTVTIITGDARGVDRAASRAAEQAGLSFHVFKADWDSRGKAAGFIRNELMASNIDRLVAFWDGVSRGTLHMITTCQDRGIPVEVYDNSQVPYKKEQIPRYSRTGPVPAAAASSSAGSSPSSQPSSLPSDEELFLFG